MNSLIYNFDLICHLVRRDFSLRYKRSVLGMLWSLMQPLAQLLVLVFLFEKVVPLNIDAYPVFVFCALLPWTWFSACLSSAGSLFVGNRDMVRRPNFIPANLVIINTLSNLITFLLALPILFAMLVLYDKTLTLYLLYLPLLMLLQGVFVTGLGMILATLNVFYRDVQYVIGVALMLLFYLTPVFYQSQTVTEGYRTLYTLNPIAVLIESYRAIFFYGTAPEWSALLFVGIASVVVCGLGYLVYSCLFHNVIDTI